MTPTVRRGGPPLKRRDDKRQRQVSEGLESCWPVKVVCSGSGNADGITRTSRSLSWSL